MLVSVISSSSAAGRQLVFGQDPRDVVGQGKIVQAARRQVDRDAYLVSVASPRSTLGDGRVEDEACQLVDHF